MVVKNELQKVFFHLLSHESVEITFGGFTITVRVVDNAKSISLSTTVYFGGNFIPNSVRACLEERPPFKVELLHSFVEVDEENFSISLNYADRLSELNKKEFLYLVEEFALLANQWHLYLDDHDKKDLIRVRVS